MSARMKKQQEPKDIRKTAGINAARNFCGEQPVIRELLFQ